MSKEDPASLDDLVMQAEFRRIIAERGIKVIVETGVHHGLSTVILSKMVPLVFGVENNLNSVYVAANSLRQGGVHNAVLCAGSSPAVLKALSPVLPEETLYFLDAHWQAYWPLLDEIAALRPGAGVIIIHDFQVPGHPELGFDSYGGRDLNHDYVRSALSQWSPGYRLVYNERTEGCDPHPRGCAYVFPR